MSGRLTFICVFEVNLALSCIRSARPGHCGFLSSKAGWSWGCVSAVDSEGRTIWIADAHRDDGKRFVVRADEKLTAFMELESAIL